MEPANFSQYVQIKGAAEILGVSPATVRNWANQGKLKVHRHPVNDYRLFDPADLRALLERAQDSEIGEQAPKTSGSKSA